jgi:hypothetical protein
MESAPLAKIVWTGCVLVAAMAAGVGGCRNDESLEGGGGSDATYYRTMTDAARESAKVVERALREAGVCDLPVYSSHAKGTIRKDNIDDVFSYFMLIANVESRLGEAVKGQGGSGILGINMVHMDHPPSATYGGKTYRCRRVSQTSLEQSHVLNAECAFALYLNDKGFGDWGRDSDPSWGSNRKIPELGASVIAGLRRSCSSASKTITNDPACLKSKVTLGGDPMTAKVTTSAGGGLGNVLRVDVIKECPATTVAVKLFTSRAGANPSQETAATLSLPPGKHGSVDISWLKNAKPNLKYTVARVQLKHGSKVLATLPLVELHQFVD